MHCNLQYLQDTSTQCAAVTMTTGLQLSRAAPHPRHRLSDLEILSERKEIEPNHCIGFENIEK